jgi:hypothetical protein
LKGKKEEASIRLWLWSSFLYYKLYVHYKKISKQYSFLTFLIAWVFQLVWAILGTLLAKKMKILLPNLFAKKTNLIYVTYL